MKKRIYLLKSGTLERESNTVVFITPERKIFLPVKELSSLHVFGEVNMNKRFLEFIAENYVSIHFYNYYGYYTGSFFPKRAYNSGIITLRQAEHYLDQTKRLYLACKFVHGAISNMRVVLNYYKNRGIDVEKEISDLNRMLVESQSCKQVSELMGIEGNAREVYYQSFNKLLRNDEFSYDGRSRRPPRTKLNTLLSFGNSLLYAVILGEIYKTHLDPRIGYLHSTNSRKFSLNLDVSELFKPLIVDRVIFTLVNKSMLNSGDFSQELEGLLLSDSGKRKFVQEFESRLNTTIVHRLLRRKVSYQGLVRMELYKLEKHLLSDRSYSPFIMYW
jgi:CRISPR-associated protein Cas1